MNRRRFLWQSGLMAAAPFVGAVGRLTAAQAPAGTGKGADRLRKGADSPRGLQPLDGGKIGNTPSMKIADIKTFLVGTGGRNWVYVKILTDQGLFGIGEAYSAGPDEATIKVIEDFKLWLVGQDPRNVQYLFDVMYNTTRFPGGIITNSAISGIEHALWDIAAKSAGVPVWALLGGRVRNKIRVYQSISGTTPQEAAESAKALVDTYGYTALKMGISASGDMPYNQATRLSAERVRKVACTTILTAIHAAQSALSMWRPPESFWKREFTCGAPLCSQVQCQAMGSRSMLPTTGRARTV